MAIPPDFLESDQNRWGRVKYWEVEIAVVIEVMSEGKNAVGMARDTLSDLDIAGE